jgi:hypothetical protein
LTRLYNFYNNDNNDNFTNMPRLSTACELAIQLAVKDIEDHQYPSIQAAAKAVVGVGALLPRRSEAWQNVHPPKLVVADFAIRFVLQPLPR